jgi:beta-glucanase (GH16 family)
MPTSAEHEASEPLDLSVLSVTAAYSEERAELARVLRHPEISRSISLVRFLTFICRKYFEQRSDEIREHSIAVHALGRKESTFDSQVDPIVRVTARALRKRLREYYDHEGKNDPLEIVIPLGRYIPQFVRHSRPAADSTGITPAEFAGFLPSLTQDVSQSSLNSVSTSIAESGDDAAGPAAASGDTEELTAAPMHGAAKVHADLSMHAAAGWSLRNKVLCAVALLLAFLGIFYAGIVLGRRTHSTSGGANEALKWGEPVWSDEFNGKAMDAPDSGKWAFDVGSQNSWGNHELETYCAPGPVVTKGCNPLHPNAFLDGSGHLVVRAQRDSDGNWTSARITTRGIRTFQYGRIEARMKLPVGIGLWPAFWMLGADFDHAGWPAAGAVDIMENVDTSSRSNGLGPDMIRASLHGPGYAGGNSRRHDYRLPNSARVDDSSFHTYGILWSPGMMQFYVDDPSNIFFVEDASSLPEGGQWVFDKPFYLVMNLAVGGDWSGDPDSTTPGKNDLLIDYVRVYRIPNIAPTISWPPVRVVSGAGASIPVTLHAVEGTGRVFLSCSTEPASAVCSLESSTVDFSKSDEQEDTLTILTEAMVDGRRAVAPPGSYRVTISAITMSGDRAQSTEPFDVVAAGR